MYHKCIICRKLGKNSEVDIDDFRNMIGEIKDFSVLLYIRYT